jgi:hypothetical protein
MGHSQGSNIGPLAHAFMPEVHAIVLSGASGGLIDSLLQKTSPVNIKDGMALLLGETLDEQHPVLTVMQTFIERSDAINYTPLLIRKLPAGVSAKHLFQVWGDMDTYTPATLQTTVAQGAGLQQDSTTVIQSLFGLQPVARPIESNVTSTTGPVTAAVAQYAPTTGLDGHFVSSTEPQAMADMRAFLTSWANLQAPRIP